MMSNDGNMTIEKLRAEVENEHRFKSVRRGYDKKIVNAYLEEMEEKHQQQLELEREKTKVIQNKNQQLMEQIDKMNEKIDTLISKLENREATENAVVESMMNGLKETNSRLMEENSEKQVKIAELETRLQSMEAEVIDYTDMLSALDKKLKDLLNEKVNECSDVIAAWELQFEQTKNDIRNKIKCE